MFIGHHDYRHRHPRHCRHRPGQVIRSSYPRPSSLSSVRSSVIRYHYLFVGHHVITRPGHYHYQYHCHYYHVITYHYRHTVIMSSLSSVIVNHQQQTPTMSGHHQAVIVRSLAHRQVVRSSTVMYQVIWPSADVSRRIGQHQRSSGHHHHVTTVIHRHHRHRHLVTGQLAIPSSGQLAVRHQILSSDHLPVIIVIIITQYRLPSSTVIVNYQYYRHYRQYRHCTTYRQVTILAVTSTSPGNSRPIPSTSTTRQQRQRQQQQVTSSPSIGHCHYWSLVRSCHYCHYCHCHCHCTRTSTIPKDTKITNTGKKISSVNTYHQVKRSSPSLHRPPSSTSAAKGGCHPQYHPTYHDVMVINIIVIVIIVIVRSSSLVIIVRSGHCH